MIRPIVVTGTDTGVGKTVFAAGLTMSIGASYWKPVQAGLTGETDSEAVARLSGIPGERIIPEAYRLREPASPHLAAKLEGITVCEERLSLPRAQGPLVIEGAGGIYVPLSDTLCMADLFARWDASIVVCARTSLGTINHSVLTVRALQSLGITTVFIVFVGDPHKENERLIPELLGIPCLGRLPRLDPLSRVSLRAAMEQHIDTSAVLRA